MWYFKGGRVVEIGVGKYLGQGGRGCRAVYYPLGLGDGSDIQFNISGQGQEDRDISQHGGSRHL
jgi:hypothetical protein